MCFSTSASSTESKPDSSSVWYNTDGWETRRAVTAAHSLSGYPQRGLTSGLLGARLAISSDAAARACACTRPVATLAFISRSTRSVRRAASCACQAFPPGAQPPSQLQRRLLASFTFPPRPSSADGTEALTGDSATLIDQFSISIPKYMNREVQHVHQMKIQCARKMFQPETGISDIDPSSVSSKENQGLL